MAKTITFNSAKEIYNTIMSGQDLYCLDTEEFFTQIDETLVAIYVMDIGELQYYIKKCEPGDPIHLDEIIPQLATEILEPNIITPDGDVITPDDPEYDEVDLADYDPSDIIAALSDLPGKKFIYADVDSLLKNSAL